ncbi:MAG: bifunctional diaminohydroxyphosphoribosylaminopyrimidine deaminase/5-amino-6-(5-phosphoribosylamino)uracil reductase RibD [Bdellovibrionales bacterium]|nr:bifunctional diaminohydroxyphosphoribosylaminopyrimidine deaminase/5-amino-6-(5-phosphoribosylamino)uracil reductase RibD [Bdellovibrionales bacterium]
MTLSDADLMRQALAEARLGGHAVKPNPQVGAALLSLGGELVLGHHQKVGGPHAEAQVLSECVRRGINPRGATIAVTLEPCSHHGRTPPCADALVNAGVARVIVGGLDPFPLVAGRGLERLRNAGIEVIPDVLREECEALNTEWLFAHRHVRPYVRLKMATSIDGLWTAADGESQWITGPAARARGHELRALADSLITGRGTVERDDPQLTVRLPGFSAPQPKVWILSRTRTIDLAGRKLASLPGRAESRVVADLSAFLSELYQLHQFSVLVEAGPQLTGAFLAAGLFEELWAFTGARLLGGAGARLPAMAGGHLPGLELHLADVQSFPEGDLLVRWRRRT